MKYIFIGNNLAVDLVNTKKIVRGTLVDLLKDTSDVADWAEAAGLTVRPKPGADILPSIRELRKALKVLLETKFAKQKISRDTLKIINRYLVFYPPQLQLRSLAGELHLGPMNESLTTEEFLGKLAYEGAHLLASSKAKQLKKCENHKCVLMFVDTSKANRRRWCSMKICGNQAKVATHYINSKN